MSSLSLVVAAVSLLLAAVVLALRRRDSAVLALALVCVAAWCVFKSQQWAAHSAWSSIHWLPAVAGWSGAMLVLACRTTTPGWRPARSLATVLVAVPGVVLALDLILQPPTFFGGWAEVDGERELLVGPGWYAVVFYDALLVAVTLYFLIARLLASVGRDRWIVTAVLVGLGSTAVAQAAPGGTDYINLCAAVTTWMLGYGMLVERLTEHPIVAWSPVAALRADPVTGALDRSSLDQQLEAAISEADRTGRALSLVLVDVDDLKKINDHYGHLVGDQVLRGVVEMIRDALVPGLMVGRFGGDEFVVLLPEVDGDQAPSVMARIQGSTRRPIALPGGDSVVVTFSAGVATHVAGGTRSALLDTADRAMYAAKRSGGDRLMTSRTPHPSD